MKVISISYLESDSRVFQKASKTGKFSMISSTTWSGPRVVLMGAQEFIKHPNIKDKDPVLTLDSGDKLRVYLGGDSSSPVVLAVSAAENHDESFVEEKPSEKERAQKKTDPVREILDDYDFPFDPEFDFGGGDGSY